MFSGITNSLIAGGTYYHITGLAKEFDALQQHIAVGAFHDSAERFNPPRCLPETRIALMSQIMEWLTKNYRETFLIWLYGMVGTGKSALAQSIAEQCQAEGLLAASFFFSRKFEHRCHEKRLAATIAYQLAISLPEVRTAIEAAIHQDPSIFDRAFQTQFQKLIVQPLLSAIEERPIAPKLVIIDGLDECHDHKVQCYVLNVICQEFQRSRHLPLLFMITSRPEEHLRMTFNTGHLARLSLRISLGDYFSLHDDIQIFLVKKLTEIKETHPLKALIPATWPSQNVIETLVLKSSGQFAYAATVTEYVSSVNHRPTDRLDVVLGLSLADHDLPFSELDALYRHIFSAVTDLEATFRILGAVLLMDLDMPPSVLEAFLFLRPGDVYLHLSPLSSVVTFQDQEKDVKIQHASLADFLLDSSRSDRFHLQVKDVHADIAACCLRHLRMLENLALMNYACYNFDLHFRESNPSRALRNELLAFQVGHVNRSIALQPAISDTTLTLEDVWYFIPNFFGCLDNSVIFEDIQTIHESHMESFDNYLKAEFEKYSVDDRLIDLVTMLIVYQSPIVVQNLEDAQRCKDLVLQFDARTEHLIMIDENSLNLRLMVRRHSQSEPFIELLCRFLDDPQRSGDHRIDGRKCARAAYRCLSWVSEFDFKDDFGLKALAWNLEIIPQLLLRAACDNELIFLLQDFTIQTKFQLTREPYYPLLVKTVQEARLAYLISTSFPTAEIIDENAEAIHAQLDIVPQGIRISSSFTRLRKRRILNFDGLLKNGISEISDKICCYGCLFADYFAYRREGDVQLDNRTHIIVHVEDPFPERNTKLTTRLEKDSSNATVPGVMRILAYKIWTDLMQDQS